MRSGGSKSKGSRFERSVCRDLSLWVSGGQREDVFWRSAMSGGRATVGLKTGTVLASQAGDVSLVAAAGEALLNHIVVECKFYQDLDVLSGITNDTGKLHRFWHELVRHSVSFGRRPMLIARQNGMPTVCLLQSSTSFLLFGLTPDHVSALLPRWDCHLILFDVFLRAARVPGTSVCLTSERRVRL